MPPAAATMPVDDLSVDLDRVPVEVRERLWAMEAAADEAYARLRTALDRADELRPELAAAQREFTELDKAYGDGKLLRRAPESDHPSLAQVPDVDRRDAAQRRVLQIKERQAKEAERREALSASWGILARRHRAAVDYLAANRRRKLTVAEPVNLDLRKGETLGEALARVRDALTSLKKEARAVSTGPGSIEEARAQARRIVDSMAAKGTPDVTALFGRSATIRWPMWSAGGGDLSINGYQLSKPDGAAMLVAMFREQFIGWLDELIDQHGAALAGTMTNAQRSERLRQIEAETLRLCYVEQALLDQSAADGAPLPPRDGADVRAILMLSPDSPGPRTKP